MKLGILGFPTVGGSGMMASRIAIEFGKKGYDVTLFSYNEPFYITKRNRKYINLEVIQPIDYSLFNLSGQPIELLTASSIVKAFKENKIELVHAHYAIPFATSLFLAKQMQPIPTVLTFHGSDVHLFGNQWYSPLVRKALLSMDATTAVSNFLSKLALKTYRIPPPQTIYNFIDTNLFHSNYPSIKPEHIETLLVHASNFRPIKNVLKAVQDYDKVCREYPDTELWLIGHGPTCASVKEYVQKNGLEKHVKFLGLRRDIPQLFSSSDILLSPSIMESFGLTIAEAMSSETAIWASNVGGIPEVVKHGENGFLFPLDDQQTSISYLRTLLDDKLLLRKFKKQGRRRIEEYFTVEKIIQQYETLYYSLL